MSITSIHLKNVDRTRFLKSFNQLAERKLEPEKSSSADTFELTPLQSIRESVAKGTEWAANLVSSRSTGPKTGALHRKEVYRTEQNLEALKRNAHIFGQDLPSLLAAQAIREMENIPGKGLVGVEHSEGGSDNKAAVVGGKRLESDETKLGRLNRIVSSLSASEGQVGPETYLVDKAAIPAASDGPSNYLASAFIDNLSDSTLAFVVAHERAHSFRQHSVTRAGMGLLADEVGNRALKSTREANAYRQELEADADAMRTVVKAGHDPRGAFVLFQAMNKKKDATHPGSQERFDAGLKVLSNLGVEFSEKDRNHIAREAETLSKKLRSSGYR